MKLTEELIAFIEMHSQDDPTRLLLNASRYPEVNIPFVVEQITARRQIREKLPAWYANKALVFPSKLAAEQCSSEQTACYKQALVDADDHVCDLTGGLGIDSYFFSQKARKVTYIERFADYAEAARLNYGVLGVNNITVVNGYGEDCLDQVGKVDVFYLDPARRGEGNKRVFALSDCEPDLIRLYPRLLDLAPKVIAKISPMADIMHTWGLLPETAEVHVVSVRNECKELLFILKRGCAKDKPVQIVCVNLHANGKSDRFVFSPEEERTMAPVLSDVVGSYLYEPNASLLKAGAFKVLTTAYPVKKLHVNSHLYTSDSRVENFPGRIFEVEEVLPFSSALCKKIAKDLPQANITVRNFPLTVDALRKKTRIRDGGSVYLFATTTADNKQVLLKTHKL